MRKKKRWVMPFYVPTVVDVGAPPWYLSGGVSAPQGAYQAIGAASLAASYVNLANPGTYDLATAAAPAFNAATGWTFNGVGNLYLDTGLTLDNDQSWSIFLRFSDNGTASRGLALSRTGASGCDFGFYIHSPTTTYIFYNGGASLISGLATSGVIGVAGGNAYFNGVDVGNIGGGSGVSSVTFSVGVMDDDGVKQIPFYGKIQAFCLYHAVLSPAQALAVTNAMAALA